MNTSFSQTLTALTDRFPQLAAWRAAPRIPLMLGAAALVALVAVALLWSRGPDYRVLFANVGDRDGGDIVAALQQMNVPYRHADGGGAILVPAGKVHDARLRLAQQGLPRGGAVGFELMDKQKFGISQFAEQINYQRALEGELARSIEAVNSIRSARVHLALPKASVFVRDRKKPSASIMVELEPGRTLDDAQTMAIAHLVSSSVPELSLSEISIVDQHGRLLSSPSAGARGLDGTQLKFAAEIEQRFVRRLEDILMPIVGAGNVRAQVTADVDFSKVEKTSETYRPNETPEKAAIRSRQSSESDNRGATQVGGVPGALSNQPPADARAPLQASGAQGTAPATTGGAANSRRDSTTNFEVDRTIAHVQQSPGSVKRLSVAVVVNHVQRADAEGKFTSVALTPEQMEQIRGLAREAMGFSEERGDTLSVVNSPFNDAVAPAFVQPWYERPAMIELGIDAGKYLLLALAALFVWFKMLKPVLRSATPQPAAAAAPEGTAAAAAAGTAGTAAAAENTETATSDTADSDTDDDDDTPPLSSALVNYEANLKAAKEMAINEPKRLATLLKEWINANEH